LRPEPDNPPGAAQPSQNGPNPAKKRHPEGAPKQ